MLLKTCTKCGESKTTSEFFSNGRGGKQACCKVCHSAVMAEQYKLPSRLVRSRFYAYRSHDKVKARSNDLTLEFFLERIERPCEYCGTTSHPRGLDRLDNSLGHLMTNVVPCCAECNRLRSDVHSPEVMRRILGPAIALARNEPLPNSNQILSCT
ncbi:hypothetical protein AWB76_07220 [Caballeronia temeraria]|uniref:HNH endonuclease n=1 Tax=Caballeronia temeraria TaxID=1777137 RepID=A0A158DQA2_9BURK|nr:hypothetical protein AWB76_07220 [Caballeronia temeraria]